jgi:hypothetical protein
MRILFVTPCIILCLMQLRTSNAVPLCQEGQSTQSGEYKCSSLDELILPIGELGQFRSTTVTSFYQLGQKYRRDDSDLDDSSDGVSPNLDDSESYESQSDPTSYVPNDILLILI